MACKSTGESFGVELHRSLTRCPVRCKAARTSRANERLERRLLHATEFRERPRVLGKTKTFSVDRNERHVACRCLRRDERIVFGPIAVEQECCFRCRVRAVYLAMSCACDSIAAEAR